MKTNYGVCLTNYGDVTSPEASIGSASLAEELGYASVWVSDHILVADTFGAEYGPEFLDPFICLSFAAAGNDSGQAGHHRGSGAGTQPFRSGKDAL